MIRSLLLILLIFLFSDLAEAVDLSTWWNQSQAKFAAGDYAGAEVLLKQIIDNSAVPLKTLTNAVVQPAKPNQQWMEPVFYMLAASYFNGKDYENALEVFKRYEGLFPNSRRIYQVYFSEAQAQYFLKAYDLSEALFKKLTSIPIYHDKSIYGLIQIYLTNKNDKGLISLLEGETVSKPISPFVASLSVILAEAYLRTGNTDGAQKIMINLDDSIDYVEDVTKFNALAIHLGDGFMHDNKIDEALNCYRRVRDNDEIVSLQTNHVAYLQLKKKQNMAAIAANPLNSDYLQLDNKDIDAEIDKEQKLLATYQTLPPILPRILVRTANAYAVSQKYWEAAVVFTRIIESYSDTPEAETATYGLLVSLDKLKRTASASKTCEEYLTRYPQGKYLDSVTFIQGILAYDAQDYDKAANFFLNALSSQPNNPRREEMELILGDIRLNQQNFDEAINCYKKYIADYPTGVGVEKAQYRSCLALIFNEKLPEAQTAISQYLTDHSGGIYVGDAEYRLAVIDFANKQYDKVLADCAAWQTKHPGDDETAAVLSLVGDCDLSMGKPDDAIDAYLKSSRVAKDNKVLSYSLFSATKLLQKARQWDKIIDACNDFIQNDPDNSLVVSAVAWIGRAKIKLGKVDEARTYMEQAIKKYIDDPTKDSVDDILLQLAQISRKTTTDIGDDLLTNLALTPEVAKDGTVVARIAYLRQQVAQLRRQADQVDSNLAVISQQTPDDLSSRLLGLAADYLREHKDPEKARTYYRYLLDEYPTSESVDFAYNGLAQLSYDAQDYVTAAKFYSAGLDSGLSVTKTKDLTLGLANSMLNLNKLDDAKKYFEEIASTREWRGEDTAYSVYCLGKIEMQKGDYKAANAYFQRVYVAYRKYPRIEAKAYFDSAQAFEKLGMDLEAQNTYRDMLTNADKMADCPEIAEARRRLAITH